MGRSAPIRSMRAHPKVLLTTLRFPISAKKLAVALPGSGTKLSFGTVSRSPTPCPPPRAHQRWRFQPEKASKTFCGLDAHTATRKKSYGHPRNPRDALCRAAQWLKSSSAKSADFPARIVGRKLRLRKLKALRVARGYQGAEPDRRLFCGFGLASIRRVR